MSFCVNKKKNNNPWPQKKYIICKFSNFSCDVTLKNDKKKRRQRLQSGKLWPTAAYKMANRKMAKQMVASRQMARPTDTVCWVMASAPSNRTVLLMATDMRQPMEMANCPTPPPPNNRRQQSIEMVEHRQTLHIEMCKNNKIVKGNIFQKNKCRPTKGRKVNTTRTTTTKY